MSRGKVLVRVYELREELKVFLTNERSEYAKLLASDEWCARLAYLADIFHHLNELNTRMQGRNENLLTSTDKMDPVQRGNSGRNMGKVAILKCSHSPSNGKMLTLQHCVR